MIYFPSGEDNVGKWHLSNWEWYRDAADLSSDGVCMTVNICKHSSSCALENFTTCILYLSKCVEFMMHFHFSNSSEHGQANSNAEGCYLANWGGDGCKWSIETNTGAFNFLVFIAKKYIGSTGKVAKWCGFGEIILFLACRTSNIIFLIPYYIYSIKEYFQFSAYFYLKILYLCIHKYIYVHIYICVCIYMYIYISMLCK